MDGTRDQDRQRTRSWRVAITAAALTAGLVGLVGCSSAGTDADAAATSVPTGAASGAGSSPTSTDPAGAGDPGIAASQAQSADTTTTAPAVVDGIRVTITGGHDTDPRDGGRPVVLIAAALGVPTEVFRTAFSGVTPAKGSAPEDGQVHLNKAALLEVLGPYGITNDQLDRVSNQYRYLAAANQMWASRPAAARAVVVDGKVVGIEVTDPGAGYSSRPIVTVTGADGVTATPTVAYGTDTTTNGSIAKITLT